MRSRGQTIKRKSSLMIFDEVVRVGGPDRVLEGSYKRVATKKINRKNPEILEYFRLIIL